MSIFSRRQTIYLVDSENVKKSWTGLLSIIGSKDRMYLFYTNNSPNVSVDMIHSIQNVKNIEFIECFTGKNGLDFQLVSYLGFLIHSNLAEGFCIVSDDTGYDSVVHFWTIRGKNVYRRSVSDLLGEQPKGISQQLSGQKPGQKSEQTSGQKSGQKSEQKSEIRQTAQTTVKVASSVEVVEPFFEKRVSPDTVVEEVSALGQTDSKRVNEAKKKQEPKKSKEPAKAPETKKTENASKAPETKKSKVASKTPETKKAKDASKTQDSKKTKDASKTQEPKKTKDALNTQQPKQSKAVENSNDSKKTKDSLKTREPKKVKQTEKMQENPKTYKVSGKMVAKYLPNEPEKQISQIVSVFADAKEPSNLAQIHEGIVKIYRNEHADEVYKMLKPHIKEIYK